MNNGNSEYEFSVFGRVDLDELYDEWSRETPNESYDEPLTGWSLKLTYAFKKQICAMLFEHEGEDGVTFYRALFYTGEDDSFKMTRKVRFRETDGFKVRAIGVDSALDTLFVRRTNKEITRDFYFSAIGDTEVVYRNTTEMEKAAVKRSRRRCTLVEGRTVLFLRVPVNSRLKLSSRDPKDLVFGELHMNSDLNDENNDGASYCTEEEALAGKTAMDELRGMIGLGSIKEKVDEIVAFAKLQKLAKDRGKKIEGVNLNLSFLGNPGTAKTTVARIFARVMKENGILSKGGLIEAGRSDLVAKYTGQTAIKVKDLFEKAKGNVLFIDEAYALVDNWENEYGDEAIATIVQEMENNRDDMIVVFAGYPDKMETFLSRNPGLRSRVPFKVQFEDYSADELTAIAKSETVRRGYSMTNAAERKVHEICSDAMKADEFGNGRFSRNLVEAAIMRAAVRVMSTFREDTDLDTCFTLEECDFAAPDNLKEEKKTNVIGFKAA